MYSSSPGTLPLRISVQSRLARSIRASELETKFRQMLPRPDGAAADDDDARFGFGFGRQLLAPPRNTASVPLAVRFAADVDSSRDDIDGALRDLVEDLELRARRERRFEVQRRRIRQHRRLHSVRAAHDHAHGAAVYVQLGQRARGVMQNVGSIS